MDNSVHINIPNIVRRNLMERPGHTPYCGNENCTLRWPRTTFAGGQFTCWCGWRSNFESEFIAEYVKRNQEARHLAR